MNIIFNNAKNQDIKRRQEISIKDAKSRLTREKENISENIQNKLFELNFMSNFRLIFYIDNNSYNQKPYENNNYKKVDDNKEKIKRIVSKNSYQNIKIQKDIENSSKDSIEFLIFDQLLI